MLSKTLVAIAIASLPICALAAVTADEAKQLGTTLTAVGAEKAGNKEGTIPEYTGGLKEIPSSFKKGSGIRPSPFDADKPRLVIDAKNSAQHADKLTEGTKELLKRYPASMRLDVYPTHRVVALPAKVLSNTGKNAVGTKSVNGGLGVENMLPGVPFPIPKTGAEAMWNHLVRYTGVAYNVKYENWNVDSAGVPTLATSGNLTNEFPLYDAKRADVVAKESDPYFKLKLYYTGPARRAGEALMAIDSVNPIVQPRRAWQYLPGQRRVKLAPDLSYDTPNAGTAGTSTYSDAFVFNGALDRFDWKLVGKKEMYVPYNGYKLMYAKDLKPATTPSHLQQARVLPRRGQLGGARRRPVRRARPALSLDARQHDVQLRRQRGERRQLHLPRFLVGLVLAGGRGRDVGRHALHRSAARAPVGLRVARRLRHPLTWRDAPTRSARRSRGGVASGRSGPSRSTCCVPSRCARASSRCRQPLASSRTCSRSPPRCHRSQASR